MSREIKFRAWCPATKIMGEVGHLFWNGDVNVQYRDPDLYQKEKGTNIAFPGYVGADWRKCDHLLMQFTGLKDKKGREIYEGDLILLGDKHVLEVKFEHAKFRLYYTESHCMEWGDLCRIKDMDFAEYDHVVIGNIYENPELLSKKREK